MNLNVKKLIVKYRGKLVGYLKEIAPFQIAFQYSEEWLKSGFSISPFSLPLSKQIFISKSFDFDGLFGVFYESLPDGWGKHLLNISLAKKKINYSKLSILTKLAFVSDNGLGALSYEPTNSEKEKNKKYNIEHLALSCNKILNETFNKSNIDDALQFGSASGGSRPKVHIIVDNEECIVKFKGHQDPEDIGLREYQANILASKCGINVAKCKLIDSKICSGYFCSIRFDRQKNKKIHFVSLAGLLEQSLRYSNLDYGNLFQVINAISINKKQDLIEAFKRMCFNVYFGNRDDHGKNFGFIYDEKLKGYKLSPAYDLTQRLDKAEHEMTINGKDVPNDDDLLYIAKQNKISLKEAAEIINHIKHLIK